MIARDKMDALTPDLLTNCLGVLGRDPKRKIPQNIQLIPRLNSCVNVCHERVVHLRDRLIGTTGKPNNIFMAEVRIRGEVNRQSCCHA